MATALDRALAAEFDRVTDLIAIRHHDAMYGRPPEITMYFIFTHEHGIEPEMFHHRSSAEAEVLRLRHLAAYRDLEIGIGALAIGNTRALVDGGQYELERVL